MQTITTWIKRLSRATDIQTAKSLVSSAFEALGGADFVRILTEDHELKAHDINTVYALTEKHTEKEYIWLAPSEVTQCTKLMPNISQHRSVLLIPVKDEKIVAAIVVGWQIPPK